MNVAAEFMPLIRRHLYQGHSQPRKVESSDIHICKQLLAAGLSPQRLEDSIKGLAAVATGPPPYTMKLLRSSWALVHEAESAGIEENGERHRELAPLSVDGVLTPLPGGPSAAHEPNGMTTPQSSLCPNLTTRADVSVDSGVDGRR
jgi:hypothetical protein